MQVITSWTNRHNLITRIAPRWAAGDSSQWHRDIGKEIMKLDPNTATREQFESLGLNWKRDGAIYVLICEECQTAADLLVLMAPTEDHGGSAVCEQCLANALECIRNPPPSPKLSPKPKAGKKPRVVRGPKVSVTPPYPQYVCHSCAIDAGGHMKNTDGVTSHEGPCDVCGLTKTLTEPRDYGWPKFEGFRLAHPRFFTRTIGHGIPTMNK
jgi:hypothetical protein